MIDCTPLEGDGISHFSNAIVFAKEPNWGGLESLPFALRGYAHKREKVWVLGITGNSLGDEDPFAERMPIDYDQGQSDLSPIIRSTIETLATTKSHLKQSHFYSDESEEYALKFTAEVARRTGVSAYYFSADDEEENFACLASPKRIESYGFVWNGEVIFRFRRKELSVIATAQKPTIAKLRSLDGVRFRQLRSADADDEVFDFYGFPCALWPKSAGDPDRVLGIGSWEPFKNLPRDYDVVVKRDSSASPLKFFERSQPPSITFKPKRKPLPRGNCRLIGHLNSKWFFSSDRRLPNGENTTFCSVIDQWPPEIQPCRVEDVGQVTCSRNGRWGCEVPGGVNVRENDDLVGKVLPICKPFDRLGLQWLGMVREKVIAAPNHPTPGPRNRPPLFEINGELRPPTGIPESYEVFPTGGVVQLSNGKDVFIWDGKGYVLRRNRFVEEFDLGDLDVEQTTVPFGKDGFFCIAGRQLTYACLGQSVESHFTNIQPTSIRRGPEDSILIWEWGNPVELGVIYFPSDKTCIRIHSDLVPEVDPESIEHFIWAPDCEKLIFVTSKPWSDTGALLALPVDQVLALPLSQVELNT